MLWIAMLFMLVAQGVEAKKPKLLDVKFTNYKSLEDSLDIIVKDYISGLAQISLSLLKRDIDKKRSDFMQDSVKIGLKHNVDASITRAFVADVEILIPAIIDAGEKITEIRGIHPVYERSKKYPKLQAMYYAELEHQWRAILLNPTGPKSISDKDYAKTPIGASVTNLVIYVGQMLNNVVTFDPQQ